MIRTIEFASPKSHEVFAEPTPLGLLGLAVGCAALTPIAFGASLTPAGLRTAAIFCLLFGAGCQFLAGMMSFANHNLYGGTLFTAFAFNWVLNWWVLDGLSRGAVPDHAVVLGAETCFLIIFVVFTYGFGFYSKLLFAFLLDIVLLYVCKVANGFAGTQALTPAIAVFTVGLGVLSLWIAFALLINPVAGRVLFPVSGPLFVAPPRPSFDTSLRRAIVEVLYAHFRESAFEPMRIAELAAAVEARGAAGAIEPDLHYLAELGGVKLSKVSPESVEAARLTAAGIDFYEQVVLKKNQFA